MSTARTLGVYNIGQGEAAVIAYDEKDAKVVLMSYKGWGSLDVHGFPLIVRIADDTLLPIQINEGYPNIVALTAAQWVISKGRGFLCPRAFDTR